MISSVEESKLLLTKTFHLVAWANYYHIQLQEGAQPYAFSTPRCMAILLMKSVEKELQCMVALRVIARIMSWCSGMVVLPKANGKVRI